MSENKRYVMKPHNVYNVYDTTEYEPLDILDCCNRLNELNDKNEQLRKDNTELKEAMKRLMTDLMTKRGV